MTEKINLTLVTKKIVYGNGYWENYEVDFPKRFNDKDVKNSFIKLEVIDDEFQYMPNKLLNKLLKKDDKIRFTSDELRAIADKLDELNNKK